jgi:hypothetical protein
MARKMLNATALQVESYMYYTWNHPHDGAIMQILHASHGGFSASRPRHCPHPPSNPHPSHCLPRLLHG